MFINIGFFWFKIKPLTLSQIWEIGSIVENLEQLDIENSNANIVTEMMKRSDMIKECLDIVLTIIFRGKIKRFLFGRYIKKRLTMNHYKKIIEYSLISFQAAFFLTSLTFLKGTKTITSQTNTEGATVLGDSSEE